MSVKRIILKATENGEYADLAIDLVLSDEGRPAGKMLTLGLWGGFSENSDCVEPFLLRRNGVLDFGTAYDDDREAESNLMSGRPFKIGEFFTIRYEGEEYVFKVSRILDLE